MVLGTSSVGGPPPLPGTILLRIWDVLSCCLSSRDMSGFRNVISATTAATATSDVAVGLSYHFVFYRGSQNQDELSPNVVRESILVYRSKQV